jgi:hypothetical protein
MWIRWPTASGHSWNRTAVLGPKEPERFLNVHRPVAHYVKFWEIYHSYITLLSQCFGIYQFFVNSAAVVPHAPTQLAILAQNPPGCRLGNMRSIVSKCIHASVAVVLLLHSVAVSGQQCGKLLKSITFDGCASLPQLQEHLKQLSWFQVFYLANLCPQMLTDARSAVSSRVHGSQGISNWQR